MRDIDGARIYDVYPREPWRATLIDGDGGDAITNFDDIPDNKSDWWVEDGGYDFKPFDEGD